MSSTRLDWAAAHARMRSAQEALDGDSLSPNFRRNLLARRTEQLARPHAALTSLADEIMIFRIGTERYGFPLNAIAEVISEPKIAPIPGAPSEVAGLIQVRGEVQPVWNLTRLLGTRSIEDTELQTVILLTLDRRVRGVVVGSVEEVRQGNREQKLETSNVSRFTDWTTEDLVTILNPRMLWDATEENS